VGLRKLAATLHEGALRYAPEVVDRADLDPGQRHGGRVDTSRNGHVEQQQR
jgi:hypothetical protein